MRSAQNIQSACYAYCSRRSTIHHEADAGETDQHHCPSGWLRDTSHNWIKRASLNESNVKAISTNEAIILPGVICIICKDLVWTCERKWIRKTQEQIINATAQQIKLINAGTGA
jgi:hypothetical protein